MSKVTYPVAETVMPSLMAASRSDSSFLRRSTNCVCASRSREAIALASVCALLYSFKVMPKVALAACELSPTHCVGSVIVCTLSWYSVSRSWNCPAISSHFVAAVVRVDRSVANISWYVGM